MGNIKLFDAIFLSPYHSEEIARKSLVRWINGSRVLSKNLRRSGYNKNCKILTPKQVHIIVEHLGLP
jgi:hypothetical protein